MKYIDRSILDIDILLYGEAFCIKEERIDPYDVIEIKPMFDKDDNNDEHIRM